MEHFKSSVAETVIGSSFSLLAFSEAFNFTSELDTSWLNTKHNFKRLGQHGLGIWDPLAEHTGNIATCYPYDDHNYTQAMSSGPACPPGSVWT